VQKTKRKIAARQSLLAPLQLLLRRQQQIDFDTKRRKRSSCRIGSENNARASQKKATTTKKHQRPWRPVVVVVVVVVSWRRIRTSQTTGSNAHWQHGKTTLRRMIATDQDYTHTTSLFFFLFYCWIRANVANTSSRLFRHLSTTKNDSPAWLQISNEIAAAVVSLHENPNFSQKEEEEEPFTTNTRWQSFYATGTIRFSLRSSRKEYIAELTLYKMQHVVLTRLLVLSLLFLVPYQAERLCDDWRCVYQCRYAPALFQFLAPSDIFHVNTRRNILARKGQARIVSKQRIADSSTHSMWMTAVTFSGAFEPPKK
jgi:hypothetical protein